MRSNRIRNMLFVSFLASAASLYEKARHLGRGTTVDF